MRGNHFCTSLPRGLAATSTQVLALVTSDYGVIVTSSIRFTAVHEIHLFASNVSAPAPKLTFVAVFALLSFFRFGSVTLVFWMNLFSGTACVCLIAHRLLVTRSILTITSLGLSNPVSASF